MARPKQCRKVAMPPIASGFRPYGCCRKRTEYVFLKYDEYEAIRLLDYQGMQQEDAAREMNVSRPTLTRIYDQARQVIAQALVEGKSIEISGGNVTFGGYSQWFRCKKCHKLIDGMDNHQHCKGCHCYSSDELVPIISPNDIDK